MYNLEKIAGSNHCKTVLLHEAARDNLRWWHYSASLFNGKSTIGKPKLEFKPTSDASSKGFGAVFQQDWFCCSWENSLAMLTNCDHLLPAPEIDEDDCNINVYELFPVLVSIRRWGHIMSGYNVTVVTDNQQVYYMVRTGRSKNHTCMSWLKEIFWCCVKFDIDLSSEYIPTNENVVADTLSRLDYPCVRRKIDSLLDGVELCCKDLLIKFCRSDVEDST